MNKDLLNNQDQSHHIFKEDLVSNIHNLIEDSDISTSHNNRNNYNRYDQSQSNQEQNKNRNHQEKTDNRQNKNQQSTQNNNLKQSNNTNTTNSTEEARRVYYETSSFRNIAPHSHSNFSLNAATQKGATTQQRETSNTHHRDYTTSTGHQGQSQTNTKVKETGNYQSEANPNPYGGVYMPMPVYGYPQQYDPNAAGSSHMYPMMAHPMYYYQHPYGAQPGEIEQGEKGRKPGYQYHQGQGSVIFQFKY